jgi:hypothetical protein
MSKRNYTREERKQRNNLNVAVVVWAVLLIAVIVRWAVVG